VARYEHAHEHRYRRSLDAAGDAQQRPAHEARRRRRSAAFVDSDAWPSHRAPLERQGVVGAIWNPLDSVESRRAADEDRCVGERLLNLARPDAWDLAA
jgi:hypothetical protein